MSSAAGNPRLRLVGTDDVAAREQWVRHRRARHDITRENRAAAANPSLDPTDPRWVLAVRAYSQLQGSALSPERRDRVLRTARHLGIRPFDANVIIAITQDHARRGEPLSDAAGTLGVVPLPRQTRHTSATPARWAAALLLAAAANIILIWWLLSG
jgi:hypothetical protein